MASQRLMTLLLVVTIAVATGACTLLDATSRSEILSEYDEAVVAGLNVYHAHAAGDDGTGRISAALCASLNTNPSVRASAGFFGSHAAMIIKAPGQRFSYVPVVGDITRILSVNNASDYDDGFFIDRQTATGIGITDGDNVQVRLDDGAVQTGVAHVVDADRGFADTPRLWAYAAPQGNLTDCYVEFVPGAMSDDEHAVGWLTSALDGQATTISVTSMAQVDGDRLLDRYMGRSTRLLWVAGGVVTFLLLFLPMVFRRHEFALYRSVGAGRNPTALIFVLSSMAVALLGYGIGLAWAILMVLWTHRGLPSPGGDDHVRRRINDDVCDVAHTRVRGVVTRQYGRIHS
ncbi:FtsX-like permease family protein [Bifidobacterium tissieri]|uniref:FtsX-like permease family protein n=1 Tax=Bifidobacterium tissieri TaxID=1630162 RepID=UPI0011776392|nr:FtsX-like permease family protein [Bifidobacterium tissieri]